MTVLQVRTALLLVVLIAAVIGCDGAAVEAPEPERPFTVYGYLNPRSDTQAVRVFAISSKLELVDDGPIDAQVVTIEHATGYTQTWRDSIVEISKGDFRHVFWAPFRPKYDETYFLEVRRSDGERSLAATSTPPDGSMSLEDPEVLPGTRVVRQTVRWSDTELLHDVTVHYRRRFESGNRTVGRDTVSIDYDRAKRRTSDGWEVVVDYTADAGAVKEPSRHIKGVPRLERVMISALVADNSWVPPGGEFDPDLLSQPGRFSNVVNGYGFFGGGYPDTLSWVPDDAVLQRIGLGKGAL